MIDQNTISTNEAGIVVCGWNNRVENNVISNSIEDIQTGIYMVYAYNTVVSGNELSGIGGGHGIFMRRSSNNTIIDNKVSGVDPALPANALLMWSSCKNNLIKGNTFSNIYRGMALFYGCDNSVISILNLPGTSVFL